MLVCIWLILTNHFFAPPHNIIVMSQTNFIYFLEADDKIVGSPIMIITFLLVEFTFS